jgi:CHAD domain-containing protein
LTQAKEFLLPEDLDLGLLGEALGSRFGLQAETKGRLEQRYFDTFDGRLHGHGRSLVQHHGRLSLVNGDGHAEIASAEWRRPKARMLVADLPEGVLRSKLAPLVEVRALTSLAHIRGRRRVYRVTDGEDKTVVRLLLDEPELVGENGHGDAALRPRLRVVAVRGYDRDGERVARLIGERLGLKAAKLTLQDEAVKRAGGTPGGCPSRPDVELRPNERAGVATARLLRRQLEVVERNVPGAIADVDTEFLHDLRVGVRRTRSLLRELRAVFPPGALAHFREEFRWLQQVTGPCRDLDVYLLDFDDFRASLTAQRGPDLDPLHGLLKRRRTLERRRLLRALRSERTSKLLAGWAAFLDQLEKGSRTAAARGAAVEPIADVAGEPIGKVYRRMVKTGGEIDDASPPEALHDLRKQGKELRYLLEFFAALYPDRVVSPAVRSLKSLQDTLGRFQDRQVQALLIHSLGDEVRALDDGAAALMAMGQLIERLEEQEAEARAEFADRFAGFAAKRQQALMGEMFA